VHAHYPDFIARLAAQDRSLPAIVREEFESFLRCGVLEQGFLRVVCEHCHAERLLAFSCKKRGFCPSCGARRMAESARHLVEEVFGPRPVRQWVLSFPYPLRFLFASRPDAIGPVLGIVHRVIVGWLAAQAQKQGSEYSFSGPQGLSAGRSQEQMRRNRTLTLVSRVTPRRARCRRQNRENNTQRPRSRREALGPLPENEEKCPRTALPNTHQPAQKRPNALR